MKRLYLGLTVLALSCGEESAEDESLACEGPLGAYRTDFVELSGTCGPLDPGISVYAGREEPPDECDGFVIANNTACEVMLEITCGPNPATGHYLTIRGSVRWSDQGRSGAGTFDTTIQDAYGRGICASIYDVTYTRT